MGKKNAAAGLGLAAVAARVTAANTRAVVRVGRMETSIGAWTDSHLRGKYAGLWFGSRDGHHEMVDFLPKRKNDY
jgi:hypothetical protein